MKNKPFYTFLIALYPILFYLGNNIDRMLIQESFRTFFIVIAGTVIFFALIWLVSRNIYKAALVTMVNSILFFSYGHVMNLFSGKSVLGFALDQADVIAAVWAAVSLLGTWWIIRVMKKPESPTFLLNVFSLTLVFFPLLQLALFYRNEALHPTIAQNMFFSSLPNSVSKIEDSPDIYYIILDEYGRSDVLADLFEVDNSGMIQALRDKGFYVADQSHANYPLTILSLSSSLNMSYLPDFDSGKLGSNGQNVSLAMEWIQHSYVRSYLEQIGYQTIAFSTGYPPTELLDADRYIPPAHYINGFESSFLQFSILTLGLGPIHADRARGIVLSAFEQLAKVAAYNPGSPKFVFAHIQAAHAPFVFEEDGTPAKLWTFDRSGGSQGSKTYREAYRSQAIYIQRLVESSINSILANSKTPPIIILQSDHGPQSMLNWYSIEKTCLKERMSILNALYLPGYDMAELDPALTPVNTFRIIFDHYFGTSFGRLENRMYFTHGEVVSYQFVDITDQVDACHLPTVTLP